jgi:hypothetical protein
MGKRATVGTCLASLVKTAMPLCKRAERECPRTGPGRKPVIPDRVLAVLITVAVLKRRKAKSAQYRSLEAHRRERSSPTDPGHTMNSRTPSTNWQLRWGDGLHSTLARACWASPPRVREN